VTKKEVSNVYLLRQQRALLQFVRQDRALYLAGVLERGRKVTHPSFFINSTLVFNLLFTDVEKII
jgi:hypothetical protein